MHAQLFVAPDPTHVVLINVYKLFFIIFFSKKRACLGFLKFLSLHCLINFNARWTRSEI